MSVPVFDPQISVVLKKNIGRANVGGAISASKRFQGTAREIDLTPWLSDGGGVKTQKSVREPAGSFTITLADRMETSEQDSLYAAIEPMDVVIIRMARDVSKYSGAFPKHMPIHMRGFVTDVRRSEVMTDRGPRRTVTIYGQDYGKILQINQIIYLPTGPTGNKLLTVFNLFANYGVPVDVDQDASAFVTSIVDLVVNQFISDMEAAATENGVANFITPLQSLQVDAIVKNGLVSPYGTNQWPGGNVYDMLKYFGDVGLWNEMFVEDREDAPYLVYRPNPFKDVSGNFISPVYGDTPMPTGKFASPATDAPAAAETSPPPVTSKISDADLISLDVERSDAGVANYYWVDNSSYQMIDGTILKSAFSAGSAPDFYLANYPNSSPSLYGYRQMLGETMQGPRIDGKPAAKFNQGSVSAIDFVTAKRNILIDQNKDNVVFEKGSMTLRGNETIKAGTYLNLSRGSTQAEYYVHTVSNDFSPMKRYVTSISFDRGTGFINRVQRKDGAYLPEMRVGGVYK